VGIGVFVGTGVSVGDGVMVGVGEYVLVGVFVRVFVRVLVCVVLLVGVRVMDGVRERVRLTVIELVRVRERVAVFVIGSGYADMVGVSASDVAVNAAARVSVGMAITVCVLA
jgi:hypothetical protein